MMETALCINEGGSDNLGDQAISKSLEILVKSKFNIIHSYNFTTILDCNELLEKQNQTHRNLKDISAFRKILSKINLLRQIRWIQLHFVDIVKIAKKKYKIAFIGGGQLILSNTIFPIAFFLWVIVLRLFGTKIIVIGVGSGRDYNLIDKFLYGTALRLCTEILVRDKLSMQRIKENFGQKTNFIPDLAFYHEFNQNKNNSSNRLIVGIITYEIYKNYFYEINSPDQKILLQDEYISAWLQKILSLKDKFDEIELISTTSEDIIFSKMLFEELKIFAPNIKVTFIDYVMNLEAYLKRLSDSKIILSARMHSLILAQVKQCEVVPWVVSEKILSYKNEYLHKDTSIIAREIKNILDIALERLDK